MNTIDVSVPAAPTITSVLLPKIYINSQYKCANVLYIRSA